LAAQLKVRKAPYKACNGHPTFQSCKAKPCALVNAKPKSQVFVGCAVQVQQVWLVKNGWVTVGSANAKRDQAARRYGLAADHCANCAGHHAAPIAKLVGGFKPQKLIGGQRHDVAFLRACGLALAEALKQLRALLRVLRQANQSVAYQVGGGFVSCVEQKNAVL
jgi:hypothetical protein